MIARISPGGMGPEPVCNPRATLRTWTRRRVVIAMMPRAFLRSDWRERLDGARPGHVGRERKLHSTSHQDSNVLILSRKLSKHLATRWINGAKITVAAQMIVANSRAWQSRLGLFSSFWYDSYRRPVGMFRRSRTAEKYSKEKSISNILGQLLIHSISWQRSLASRQSNAAKERGSNGTLPRKLPYWGT